MPSNLRIAVTGLAATYPFGGVFWDYIQYVLGLHRLGHEVLYIEDTGQWCYSPRQHTYIEDGADNAAHLNEHLQRLEPALAGRWFFRDATGRCFGRSWQQVCQFCRDADMLLHISASCWLRDEYLAARRLVFLDSDPMYTQASFPDVEAGTADAETTARVARLQQHDVFFTFALNMGSGDCRVPPGPMTWHPTRQPVVLDCFTPLPLDARRRVLTTVASWEPREDGPTVDGVRYAGKSVEFLRMIDLPACSPLPLELAMGGPAPVKRLASHGWRVQPALEVSGDPWVYRDYLARSFGEWSVAKQAYAAGRTGWFSTRTACYLALGVPAVVQDTGFSHIIPTGEGVLTFSNTDEAAAAIESLYSDPQRHARSARQIAETYFASDRVLGDLLNHALASEPATGSPHP